MFLDLQLNLKYSRSLENSNEWINIMMEKTSIVTDAEQEEGKAQKVSDKVINEWWDLEKEIFLFVVSKTSLESEWGSDRWKAEVGWIRGWIQKTHLHIRKTAKYLVLTWELGMY